MSDGGFFGEFDVAGAADDPFSIDDGTYRGQVTGFDGDIGGKKNDGTDYRGMQFTLTVTEGDQEGATYDQYFALPTADTSVRTAGILRSSVKKFLAGLEVPISRMNTIDPNDLLGIDVIFTIETTVSKRTKKKFRNIEIRVVGSVNREESGSVDVSVAPIDDNEFGLLT